jgi:hypothetical protein
MTKRVHVPVAPCASEHSCCSASAWAYPNRALKAALAQSHAMNRALYRIQQISTTWRGCARPRWRSWRRWRGH